MEYNYDELIERYYDKEELTDEEYAYVEKILLDKVRKGESVSHWEFEYLDERFFYEYGDITDELRHGWVWREIILKFSENEFYSCNIAYHNDYGFDTDEIDDFCRVEKRNVVVQKWVPVEEN